MAYRESILQYSNILLLLLLPFCAINQSNFQLKFLPLDAKPAQLEKIVTYQSSFSDSISLIGELKDIILKLQGQAYLEASIDTLVQTDSIYVAMLHLGRQFEWANLKNGNVEEVFLEQVGFRERLYRNKPFSYKDVRKLQESLLTYAENNGYPFARVWLDSIRIQGEKIRAQVFMEKNQLVLIEKLSIQGDVKLSKAYLNNYLGIAEGSLYSKEKVLRIRDRIRELAFLQAEKDPTITFEEDRATINLFLKKKRASQFDFLIGILPNSTSSGGERRILITGTFKGEMQNQFALGERIYAEFEQLRPQTQQLDLEFSYPYILNLPFGVDLKFDLYKRDTTYLDLNFNFGIQYLFEGGNYLKAFWHNYSTTLLTVDQQRIIQTQQLPENLDVSNSTFGLEYSLQRLDYRFNPRKGWSAFLRGGAGIKRIKRNNKIEEIDFGELYDTLQLRTFQYRIEAKLERFLPLFNRSTIKAAVQGGSIIAQENIYLNEQFRLGGNKLLRGFDEETIFATNFAVATLEYRLLIGQNSYLYTFGDYAYVQDRTSVKDITWYPYGFGAGITFETKVGVFGVSLAFGKQRNASIDFGTPKVHFGYVSLF